MRDGEHGERLPSVRLSAGRERERAPPPMGFHGAHRGVVADHWSRAQVGGSTSCGGGYLIDK